jgi:hypothetical protein
VGKREVVHRTADNRPRHRTLLSTLVWGSITILLGMAAGVLQRLMRQRADQQ